VRSNVARKLKMILTVALTNARTRLPFPGVAEFYRALHAGVNPIFYVSKSPWNLYAPLIEYLAVQGLPLGPLILRDFGFSTAKNHKTIAIEDILATYPKLNFILIGDSGEQDPEIYGDIVRRFPGRIGAVYIRAVTKRKVAMPDRCPMVLAPDTEAAAAHAAAAGLIQASDLRAVRAGKRLDESSSSKAAVSWGGLK
jgi:phosphatidate phosphatase APP1